MTFSKFASLNKSVAVPIIPEIGSNFNPDDDSAIIYLEKTLNSPTLTDGKTEYLLGAAYLNTQNTIKGCLNLKAAEKKNYAGAAELVAQYCK